MPKKSRGQKRQAKTKKRQQRRSRPSSSPSMPMPSPFLGGMPFGVEPDVPKGFRPVSMTQAMIEYAAPIMAYFEDGTVGNMNDALQVGMLLWNQTLPEVPQAMRQSRAEIVTQIETTLQMDRQEAEACNVKQLWAAEMPFSTWLSNKKGVEIGLPICVSCHVAKCTSGIQWESAFMVCS